MSVQKDAKTPLQYTHVVGIDEVGRGPLAGPVAVCAAAVAADFNIATEIPGARDSKVMSAALRERVYATALAARDSGSLMFAVAYGSPERIDRDGITAAIAYALGECISALALAHDRTFVYLDGLLRAPPEYAQETVIHGDALVPVISLASVIAKVSRDALMVELAHEYPQYGFEHHKGYGTAAHIRALKAYGPSPLHRRSFIRKILVD